MVDLNNTFETNLMMLLNKPHYKQALIILKKFGYLWTNILIKFGINPLTATRIIRKLKELKIIEEAGIEEKEKLKEFLATRIRSGRAGLINFKPYKISLRAKTFFEKHEFVNGLDFNEALKELWQKYEEWKREQRAKKGEIKKLVGKCALCGKGIYKITYFDDEKVWYYGTESLTGSKLPIDGFDKPWKWVCGECIRKDPKLKELRRYIIQHKIKEPHTERVKEEIEELKEIKEAKEKLRNSDSDVVIESDKEIISHTPRWVKSMESENDG